MSYPQQPPPGQPHWGYPSGYPHAPMPPAWQPPPRRTSPRTIVLLIALGLFCVAGFVAIFVMSFSLTTVRAGDCVSLDDERGGVLEKAACGSSFSDYQVVSIVDGDQLDACPENFGNVWGTTTYCMVLDVAVGECLTEYTPDEGVLPIKTDCGDPETSDQVTNVVPNSNPEGTCGPGDGYYVFRDPARTVCFADPQSV